MHLDADVNDSAYMQVWTILDYSLTSFAYALVARVLKMRSLIKNLSLAFYLICVCARDNCGRLHCTENGLWDITRGYFRLFRYAFISSI